MALVTKNFSDIITFTRASTGTYFDSAGVLQSAAINTPRFDYDPVTLAARGFLIEEARTNRILYSEDFGDASWVKNGGRVVVTTNQIAAPDGTVTADFLGANGGASGSRSITQTDTSSATGKSQSVFAKAGTATFLQILFGTDAAPWANFDLSTGTVGSTGTVTSATITPVGNGWYRCQVTTASTTATSANICIVSSSTAVRNESNTLSAGLYIWGAQMEAGAFATSYIPTTTTALTRSADVASVNTLSPWYNTSGGTIYAEATGPIASIYRMLAEGATASDFRDFSLAFDGLRGNFAARYVAGNFDVLGPTNSLTAGAAVKLAGSYSATSADMAYNGVLAVSKNAITQRIPADRMFLGSRLGSSLQLNGHLRRVTYYPRTLSTAELQAITA